MAIDSNVPHAGHHDAVQCLKNRVQATRIETMSPEQNMFEAVHSATTAK